MDTLAAHAQRILTTADGAEKARLSHTAAAAWAASNGGMAIGEGQPPDRPARPTRPELLTPPEMPRRRGHSPEARAQLLHAVLHIELNAIDLAWDMVARFTGEALPRDFYDDWVKVGDEEAKHFGLLATRLADLGFAYGDFPAHDGLWEAALDTKDDLASRLAIVPMVLEARGLDVTPAMINRFAGIGDQKSVRLLEIILEDEIGHVAIGSRWFRYHCHIHQRDQRTTWQALVQKYFKGLIKPPFNETARASAGLPADYYLPLSQHRRQKPTKNGNF
ncbi:ferritin-like domain-containing protein [Sneathiella sp.]|uniref:ferritin-like domain-containing protein n=1 Tax=Sneathiella sp. TaxID=1964365 RepID=UPI003565BD90